MNSFLVLGIITLILCLPASSLADKVVRDRYGNLVETWNDRNGSTDIRDRNGSLKATRTYRNGTVDVRDMNGSLVGTEEYEAHDD